MEQLNIKTILQQHQSKEGLTLEQHIRTLLNFVTTKQINLSAYDDFEIISDLLKRCHFTYKDPLTDTAVNNIQDYKCEISEWIDQCQALLKEKINQQKDQKIGYLQNFQADSEILKSAGVSFGESETYLLQKSLHKLTIETKATELHFWGKILCSGKDYYVAEGTVSNEFSEEYSKDTEAKGTGVNRQTYWVTHSVLEEWSELPVVTPQQMIISKEIKYMFTGNLENKVDSFPRFPGKEKHLLKCMIVRIGFSCFIVPGDMYQTNEENDREIELREEFKMPEFTELQNIETWAHFNPNVLQAGRVNHYQNMELNEDDRAAAIEELSNNDPVIERLKRISEDRPFEGFETNWIVKVIGDPQQYNMIGRDEGSVTCYATLVLKNLTWPGFQCISTANSFVNIYIGYGFKNGAVPFNPVQPNDLQAEPEDQEEHPEPNGKDPALEVEPDSDDENKEEDEEA